MCEQLVVYVISPGLPRCGACDCSLCWADFDGELHCLACEDPEGRMGSNVRRNIVTWRLYESLEARREVSHGE